MSRSTYGFLSVLSFFSFCVFVPAATATAVTPDNAGAISRDYAIGSTKVMPLGLPVTYLELQSRYPGTLTPTLSVTNERYSSLPLCPTTPLCPDINGNPPIGYTSTSCPPSCVVNRVVLPTPTQPPAAPLPISSTTAAVCPVSYTAVATYRADKEIQAGPIPAPFPIPNMETYRGYTSSWYDCTYFTSPEYSATYCGSIDSKWLLATPMLINIGVGVYRSTNNTEICYQNAACTGASTSYSYYSSPHCPTSHPYVGITYSYTYMQCTSPPGLSYTANTVPTSIVCSHLTPTWQ